jgi:hypothetical protein
MHSSLGDDVGVETVAEVDRVDIVTAQSGGVSKEPQLASTSLGREPPSSHPGVDLE